MFQRYIEFYPVMLTPPIWLSGDCSNFVQQAKQSGAIEKAKLTQISSDWLYRGIVPSDPKEFTGRVQRYLAIADGISRLHALIESSAPVRAVKIRLPLGSIQPQNDNVPDELYVFKVPTYYLMAARCAKGGFEIVRISYQEDLERHFSRVIAQKIIRELR